MKKFLNLLRKEIKELITVQLIVSLAFTIVLFYFIGNIARSEMSKVQGVKDVSVLDLDQSDLSGEILRNLAFANFRINLLDVNNKDMAIDKVRKENLSLLLVIPSGFADSVSNFQPKEIETYVFVRSFSVGSSINSELVNQIIVSINNYLSDNILKNKVPDISPSILKNPIKNRSFIVVKDKVAEGSISDVNNFVTSQTIFIPIILMMILVYSSQMVLSAIAMEKQDKTLETLLTVPISRNHIVIAKMLASGLVGLVSAGIYMIGFRFYMGGFMGNISTSGQVSEVIEKLNLRFTPNTYIFLGISLFLAILCALALATILGVLSEDLRSAQSASLPLVFLVLIPYFLTMFSDLNTLSLPLKIIVLAIPFTYPFLASQNLILGNYSIVIYGILYMLFVFVVLVFIAGRIFSTDKVLTMKLRFGRKVR
ncbi:MAG: ABC transporter permease [bacterium]|nr:ABC transporter permease [bacterium]